MLSHFAARKLVKPVRGYRYVIEWRTAVMSVPAFTYFRTKRETAARGLKMLGRRGSLQCLTGGLEVRAGECA